MSAHSPVVREFVKDFVMNYLSGPRGSIQLEPKYRKLKPGKKRKTTNKLEAIVSKFTDELLAQVDRVEDLADLSPNLLRECLLRAQSDDPVKD